MKEQKTKRTKWIHLRLTDKEFDLIQNRFKNSTCPKLSDFARKNLLQEPVVLKYRNESLDDLIEQITVLKNQLNPIGNNFNQAVKKLHTLNQIPEFKQWILNFELEKKILFNSINEIKKQMQIFFEKWLQS